MRYKKFIRSLFLFLAVLSGWLSPFFSTQPVVMAQDLSPRQKAQALLASMTPEERVGQLFLVSFKGRNAESDSQIAELIQKYHIGGVMLSAANDNFVGPENTISEAVNLTKALQTREWEYSQRDSALSSGTDETAPVYIPLFVGISQEGDAYPTDQVFNGLASLPSHMAVGASWDTELAAKVGRVLGKQLEAIGANLLLGPSLDVLDSPRAEGLEDMGTRSFGGDPFWVGEMGKNYIKGVHEGSANRVAVIAKHFPGRGSSDRMPDQEVATVRKSLEQLKQIELAPFFAVTGSASGDPGRTDGLLVSHIRYQGFQGNIRVSTRPVSFDSTALEQLMQLEPISGWRTNGGIVVSDDLGSQAVRKFYDPLEQTFDAKRVAGNAFLAGNDLLYLNNFIGTGESDSTTTIMHTLDYFTQKYREDPAFSKRVDLSVERLLTLKYQIYADFELENVLPDSVDAIWDNEAQQVAFEVAQESATLISPTYSELSAVLESAPQKRDRIVFITDVRNARQCSQCVEQPLLAVDSLENAVMRLFGPSVGGEVQNYQLTSYSFNDLQGMLNSQPDLPPIENDIREANWLVISLVNLQTSSASSNVVTRFLDERPDLQRNLKIIVFCFGAPYQLDATDISKLTAYYGLYSKTSAFVDAAARLLFQELTPVGALPVTTIGVGYDLISATAPDPNQVIPLVLDMPEVEETPVAEGTVAETRVMEDTPLFRVGDTIPLLAGVIYDHNHHAVPDGTVVRFLFTTGAEGGTVQQIETTTSGGSARARFQIQNTGLLEIRVTSDPAQASRILRLEIKPGEAAAITMIAPTPMISPTQVVPPTETVNPSLAAQEARQKHDPNLAFGLLVAVIVWAFAAGVAWIGERLISLRWGVRLGLLSAMGGFVCYLWMALFSTEVGGLAGIAPGRIVLLSLLGSLVGALLGWAWHHWLD